MAEQLILDAGAAFEPNAKLTIIHTGELVLEQNSFNGAIKDFRGRTYGPATKSNSSVRGQSDDATFTQTNGAGGLLQVAQGEPRHVLNLIGTYTTGNFALQSDGVHGTTVTFIP